MSINKLFVEFTKEHIEIIKLDLRKELKGGYLCIKEKRILFINNNLTDIDLVHTLKSILSHISNSTNSLDKFIHFY